ncbi:hypothetical protein ENSA7_63210 [Enhygromyxa salina]|uniref:Uncharacterized protein n=1 Tax=Enhygromyxa salina TaxID=215803 RepID=A0A2S9Y2G1_9BACT|nr:hypothetical protein ENSA7_63210 [Enhygromyxa salina]
MALTIAPRTGAGTSRSDAKLRAAASTLTSARGLSSCARWPTTTPREGSSQASVVELGVTKGSESSSLENSA